MVTIGTKQNIETGKFIAQAFALPTPENTPGAYITKIGLFFRKAGQLSELKLFLMEMNNNQPDPTKIVPGSLVFLSASEVNISEDSETETLFTFDQPVFLNSTKRYAFALQTPSSEYTIWGAGAGDKDISTSKLLGSNPVLEKVYYREINGSYSILENDDIKFKLYRAKFVTNTQSQATLRIKNKFDYLQTTPIVTKQSLSVPLSTTDKVYRSDSSGSWIDVGELEDRYKVKLDSYDGERYIYKVKRNNAGETNFSDNERFKAVKEGFISTPYQSSTVAGVPVYTTIFTKVETFIVDAKIEDIVDLKYHSIIPRFDIDAKTGSSTTFKVRGTKYNGSSYVKDSPGSALLLSTEFEKSFSDSARWIPSFSNWNLDLLSEPESPLDVIVTLNTINDYCAPIIKLNNSRALLVTNIINSDGDILNTELTTAGTASSKYVSKVITLAEGMDAEDLNVYVSAYKPPRTNVRVFARLQNAEDNHKAFSDLNWIEMEQVTPATVFSNATNPRNYIEYQYQIRTEDKTNEGVVKYTGANGELFQGFKKYSIKIVLTADTDYEFNPPKVTDLKVIALQK